MYSILTQKKCTTKEFVDFWSSFYTYKAENLYRENIPKKSFELNDLNNLFIWKNGMRLSGPKNISLERKILNKLTKVNELKLRFSKEEFDDNFGKLSTIWKIFLLHCIQPNVYPIFDQHVFRAMQFIKNNTIEEVAYSDKKKYSQYLEYYIEFFDGVVRKSNRSREKVDRALWFYGKSLKQLLIRKALKCT